MSLDLGVDEWADADQSEPPSVEERLAELEAAVVDLARELAAHKERAEPPPLKYETLPEFVEWFRSWYRRNVFAGYELVWCPDWWKHPEAVLRLEAVWRAFELLRHEPGTGISSWLRDHVDVHVPRLMASGGPLERCTTEAHADDPLPLLPVNDPPLGWWIPADTGPKPAVTKGA